MTPVARPAAPSRTLAPGTPVDPAQERTRHGHAA